MNKYDERKKEITSHLNLLFFDIEMSPTTFMGWPRTGKTILSDEQILEDSKIIMISYKWAHEKTVHNLCWDGKQSELQVLKHFQKVASYADFSIGHNSKSFDTKNINSRLCDLELGPVNIYNEEDTFKSIKRRLNYPSYKLRYLVKRLGLGEKMHLDGWDHWKEVCYNNDRKELKKMIKYCNMDVALCEKIYWRVFDYVDHPFNLAVLLREPNKCPNCASSDLQIRAYVNTRTGQREQYKCKNCGKYSNFGKNLVNKSGEYLR